MSRSIHFKNELELIQDIGLQDMVRSYLEDYTGDWFWTCGASSTGKYHPVFAQGKGGLVRHTKAVVRVADQLLRLNQWAFMPEYYKEDVIAACILHDTRKYGAFEFDKNCYQNHGRLAAQAVIEYCSKHREFRMYPSAVLVGALTSHMGQWVPNKDDRPFTPVDRCVHMADYIASMQFFDIPEITMEYNSLEEDLP